MNANSARWMIPLAMLVAVAWLSTRSQPARFMRVPVAPGPAPAWAVTNLAGERLASTNLLGKVVVLNFWATWCPPCRAEIPDLAAFHLAQASAGVVVVGLSRDEGPDAASTVRKFAERTKIPYPVALAPAEVVDSYGGAGPIPSTFIIGRDGRLVAHYLGALTRDELEKAVAPLLSRPAATAP